eukprot:6214369-Pleurochrysis_carterae.AAC.1
MRDNTTTKYLQNVVAGEVDGDRTELRPIRVQYTSPDMYKLLLEDGSCVFAVCTNGEKNPPEFVYTRMKAVAKREIRNMRTVRARLDAAKDVLGYEEVDLECISPPRYGLSSDVFADIPDADEPLKLRNAPFFLVHAGKAYPHSAEEDTHTVSKVKE